MGNLHIAMIILNYKDYKTTERLLNSILNYNSIDYIVVVDNNSNNESYERLQRFECDKCIILETKYNGGYSYGNNIGIKYAINNTDCDIISILNPDVLFDENTITRIKAYFETTDYALLSPIMYNIDGSVSNRPYWELPSYIHDVGMCFAIYRKADSKKIRKVDYSREIIPVDVLPGSFLSFRKDAIASVGYFDETLFLYCEERIIAKKLLNHGFKIGLITTAKYDHMHSVTTRKYLKEIQINKLMAKARYYYQVKYNGIGIFKRLLLMGCMIFMYCELFLLGFIKKFRKS